MTKPLPISDFRAIRVGLEPSDFALGPASELPPSDLIDNSTWHGIMDLPDDVSIRTSNHQGKHIKQMHELWVAWIEAIDDVQDFLSETMIIAIDEFQAIVFNSLHGFYSQAIGNLRNALELITIGTYCQVCGKSTEFGYWRTGQTEISFGKACDNLIGATLIMPLNSYLNGVLGDGIFTQKNNTYTGGWARRLYSELSNYSHSKPTFTNAFMWESNGPIYKPEAFKRTIELLFQTYALCYIMVKINRPKFELSKLCKQLFLSGRYSWQKVAYHSYDYLFRQKK